MSKTDWSYISTKPLSEQFIDLNAETLDWGNLCWFQDFNMDFLRAHIQYIDGKKQCWKKLSNGQRYLTEDFVREFADQIDWWSLCDNAFFKPSIEFCREMSERCKKSHTFFHWTKLSEKQLEEFINRSKEEKLINGTSLVSQHPSRLTNNFLLKWWEKVDQWVVSQEYMLNYISLEKLKDYLKWDYVSRFQHLGPTLMKKYADKLDWEQIKKWHYLPIKMKLMFKDYLQKVEEQEEDA